MTKKRIILPRGESKPITKEGREKSLEPYEQQKELFGSLTTWSNHAVEVLKAHGYTDFMTYGSTYKLTWHPPAIESANTKVQDADSVLRSVKELYDAFFQGDGSRIANAGVCLGLAIAQAEAEQYEQFAIAGKKSTDGFKERDDQLRKSSFQDWIVENQEKVKDCKTVNELRKINYISAVRVTDAVMRKWFREIYPNQLKGGRPKKL